MKHAVVRERNDRRQYDDLAGEWWRPEGPFAALHWLSVARAELLPPARRGGEVLVDVGCGGGLLAKTRHDYVHVGVDVTLSALTAASEHGVRAVRADVGRLPLMDASAAVVVAGEILEHVSDLGAAVAEIARVLRPGGTVVIDTINATRAARFALVTVAERLPGGPPPRIHDPKLFVDPKKLRAMFAQHGVRLEVWGIRPSLRDYARFVFHRQHPVRMVRTRSVGIVYQGLGTKEGP